MRQRSGREQPDGLFAAARIADRRQDLPCEPTPVDGVARLDRRRCDHGGHKQRDVVVRPQHAAHPTQRLLCQGGGGRRIALVPQCHDQIGRRCERGTVLRPQRIRSNVIRPAGELFGRDEVALGVQVVNEFVENV